MSRFDQFDRLVANAMQRWGFTALYQKITTVPNDATGGVDETIIAIPIRCIRQEQLRPLFGTGTNTGTDIQNGDLILYVQPTEKADKFADALVIDPTDDNVVIQGVTWNIVTSKLHGTDPSDPILYELYIRK
jgi:hypothetical protein